MILEAAKEREVDDVKFAIQTYVKSAPETTYQEIEKKLREQDTKLWLIAIEKGGLAATMTNMDLQGNMEKKFTVTFRFQWNPPRPRDRELWPADVDENLERLADAGEVVPRGLPKCTNCSEIGHISKSCPEEKMEADTVKTIMCYNCDTPGHRMRDCKLQASHKAICSRFQTNLPQAQLPVSTSSLARTVVNRATRSRNAQSLARPPMSNAASVTKWVTSPRTAPREEAMAAAIVARKDIMPEIAQNPRTWPMSSAETVMSTDTSARSVPSPVIVSELGVSLR